MDRVKFLDKAHNIHGYKYQYLDLPDKITYQDSITIEYGGKIYYQKVSKHLLGKCPEKATSKKTKEQFIAESRKIWGDRFDYSTLEYNGSLKEIQIFDKKLNMFISQIASLHLQGYESKGINQTQFIEKSMVISDYQYTYEKCQYVNKTTKVSITCPTHGIFEVIPFNHINYGDVCKKCSFSIFSKSIKKFFKDYNINFYSQHFFNGCNLPFDYYIPSMLTCIDFTYSNSKIIEENDKVKADYCEENYINLIVIKVHNLEDIYQILWEQLRYHIRRLKLSQ